MKNIRELRNALAAVVPGLGNAIAMGVQELIDSQSPAVERDASGVPVAWRIFRLGPNEMTRNGDENIALNFTGEMFDMIVGYFREKGGKVPLDSRHFIYRLAEHFHVDENKVLNLLPDGKATFGFADLEKRADGLWAVNVEYVPLARQLMAEGIFRWFSPVVRGLVDGRLRVTSIALENEPALNGLDQLAAVADNEPPRTLAELTRAVDSLAAGAQSISPSQKLTNSNPNKEKRVNKLFAALAGLLGLDSLSLGANQEAPEGVVEKIETLKNELPGLRQAKTVATATAAFLGAIRGPLALAADADLNAAQGAILGIAQKAGQADALKVRVDALALEAETRKRDELIAQGQTEGKLPKDGALHEWAKKQDSVALAAYLGAAVKCVPIEPISRGQIANPDTIALSASDREVCKLTGIKEEDFLKTKKAAGK